MSKIFIEFDVSNIISYHDYKDIISELSKWYEEQIKYVHIEYEELLKSRNFNKVFDIMQCHRNIIV